MLKLLLPEDDAREGSLPGWPPWMARLLRARGVDTAAAAEAFLHPSESQLLPALALHDMEKAVSILQSARDRGLRAVVYGDYDVDGVCASAILKEALDEWGLDCVHYIPDRHQEGYGLNLNAVETLAKTRQVLLTVDCGIVSVQEVQRAKDLGMTVIVTDHHRHGETLPPADAVISPLLGAYPFPSLCGAGVAWKLALALVGEGAKGLMDLAALATVADMVPLTGENRAMVALGLRLLENTNRPGLRALLRRAGIEGAVSSDQVAFQIAPRINACGRLASADIALRLLLTRDPDEGDVLALQMETLNQRRRDQEALVIREALAQVEGMDLVETRAIVVAGVGWNSGVVGLAAGRIAEKYAYPTVALAIDGEKCVGSARSAGDVDIHLALSQCADLFDRFGGHKQAAGLTLGREKLGEFSRRLSQAVAEQTGGAAIVPSVSCDGELTLSQVTEETVEWLKLLEPYGVGNPAPRFLCREVEPLSLRAVGAEGRHVKCSFRQGNDLRDGIFFGGGSWAGRTEGKLRLVMTPTLNEFRGKISAECRLYAMELQPETLQESREREALAYLSETFGSNAATPIGEAALEGLMAGGQGTVLVCRRLKTALALRERFSQADFSLYDARDPRAYNTVLYLGAAGRVSPAYRRIVLCDGDGGEAAGYQAACPRAQVYALPQSPEMKALLSDMFVDLDALRGCYRALRAALPRDLEDWALSLGLSVSQGAFSLKVLAEIQLIQGSLRPFQVSLLPMVKRGPEESALFCRARQAKEEMYGLHSL